MDRPPTFRLSSRFAGITSSPVRDITSVIGREDIISFAGGVPDPTLIAVEDLRECFTHVLSTRPERALQYSTTPGEPELREQLALRLSRQLPTTPDQIQVTNGSQEGIFLAAQTLADPGDVVLVEEPTYLAAIQSFAMTGARLQPVSSDSCGILPDALETAIHEHHPAFVYLIPTFQNPTGRTMPLERRRAVAEVLVRTDTPLLEDDPYGELRYEGTPVPPLAALEGMAGRTLLLNSASKTMAPGLRIGWIRAEGPILRTLEIAKQAVGLHGPVTDQLAVAHYLATCDLDAHIRTVVDVYRTRRDAMVRALADVLPAGAAVTRPEGGMFLWIDLRDDTDTAQHLGRAVDAGVAYVPGWPFHAGRPNRATMRLSYVTSSPAVIDQGVARLASTLGWTR